MADVNYGDLKCDNCKCYLSFSPVFVKENGHSICGNCNEGEKQLTFRNITYEAVAKRMKFPCRFINAGCGKQHGWEESKQHEDECEYRNFNCFNKDCLWIGTQFNMKQHYEEAHPDLLLNLPSQVQPNISVCKDSKYIISFLNHSFIVHVLYSVSSAVLSYYTCFLGKSDNAQFFEYGLDITSHNGTLRMLKTVQPITELFSSEKDNVIELNLNSLLSMGLITKYEDCTFNLSIKLKNDVCTICKLKPKSVFFSENNNYCDACFNTNTQKPNISSKCINCDYKSSPINLPKHKIWFCSTKNYCSSCNYYYHSLFEHTLNHCVNKKNVYKTKTNLFSNMPANVEHEAAFVIYDAVFLVKFKFSELLQSFSCNITSDVPKDKTEFFECSFQLSNPNTGYSSKVKCMVLDSSSSQYDWNVTETNDTKNSYLSVTFNENVRKLYNVKITIIKKQ